MTYAEAERIGHFPDIPYTLCGGIAITVDGRIVRRGLYETLQSDSEIHFIPALGAG